MSGWKVGDKFLLKIKDGDRYRTEWFKITHVGFDYVTANQGGTLAQEISWALLEADAIPFDDAIVNLEQGLGGSPQYTPQYEESPLKKPFSELDEGDLVEVDPDKCQFAEFLWKRYGNTILPIREIDRSVSQYKLRVESVWVNSEAIIGVDFDA